MSSKVKTKARWLGSILTVPCISPESSIAVSGAGRALKMLLKLRGLKMKDFPLGLRVSQIGDGEMGTECCFCPGHGFGTQSPTGSRGWPGKACSDASALSGPAHAVLMTDHSGNVNISLGGLRFCFATWPSFLGPFPSFEAIVFLT